MIVDHWYVCVAELTPAQARWDVARDRCRERHRMYEAFGLITKGIQMSDTKSVAEPGVGSTIVTGEGVKEAGPDIPALAAATQREENSRAAAMEVVGREAQVGQWEEYRERCLNEGIAPMPFEQWSRTITGDRIRTVKGPAPGAGPWPGAPVGRVSPEQAGILPSGPMQVTDRMVFRAMDVLVSAQNPTGASAVRKALEAALDTSR